MEVTVKVFATLRDIMDRESTVDLTNDATILQLLELLIGRHPGLYGELFDSPGKLKPYVNILKNGRNVSFLSNLDTELDNGDTVAIFPPVAGG